MCCVVLLCVRSELTRQLNTSSCGCTQRCSRYAPIPVGTRTGKEFCCGNIIPKLFSNCVLILFFILISEKDLSVGRIL